ncbi:MAG: hypothetical protein ACT4R6_00040 [Gemmatimonadaceae bacterium]
MQDRRIEGNFSQGWGVAGLITLLAIALFVTAGLVKRNTFRSPNDPLGPAPTTTERGH